MFGLNIHGYCKVFRTEVLKIRLADMSRRFGVTAGSLSHFENGRTANINYLYYYIIFAQEQGKLDYFLEGLNGVLRNVKEDCTNTSQGAS